MKARHRKPRMVRIILRGCVFRLPAERAAQLTRIESRLLRAEWNTNSLTE